VGPRAMQAWLLHDPSCGQPGFLWGHRVRQREVADQGSFQTSPSEPRSGQADRGAGEGGAHWGPLSAPALHLISASDHLCPDSFCWHQDEEGSELRELIARREIRLTPLQGHLVKMVTPASRGPMTSWTRTAERICLQPTQDLGPGSPSASYGQCPYRSPAVGPGGFNGSPALRTQHSLAGLLLQGPLRPGVPWDGLLRVMLCLYIIPSLSLLKTWGAELPGALSTKQRPAWT
jgi:hypothetical protein